MKQSDVFSIIFVAGAGILVSFFACKAIMGDPDEAVTSFTALREPITATLDVPNPEVFNSTAINPTVEIYVGDCEDRDGNGILDDSELVACGRLEAPAPEENTENTENGEDVESETEGSNQENSEEDQGGATD